MPEDDVSSGLPERVIAGAAAAVTVASTLTGPAAVIALAVLTPVYEHLALRDQRARQSAAEVILTAADVAQMNVDELIRWADEGDDERLRLFDSVVDAAARTRSAERRRTLARILADGATDGATIDKDLIILETVGTITPADLEVLRTVAEVPNAIRQPKDDEEGIEWDTDHLATHLPRLADAMDAIVGRLNQLGCIALGGPRFGARSYWKATPFGHSCLRFLRDEANSNVPQSGSPGTR